MKLERNDEALKEYTAILDFFADKLTRIRRAELLTRMGNTQEALHDYEEALAEGTGKGDEGKGPTASQLHSDAKVHRAYAELLRSIGWHEKAEEQIQLAISKEPDVTDLKRQRVT